MSGPMVPAPTTATWRGRSLLGEPNSGLRNPGYSSRPVIKTNTCSRWLLGSRRLLRPRLPHFHYQHRPGVACRAPGEQAQATTLLHQLLNQLNCAAGRGGTLRVAVDQRAPIVVEAR